MIECRCPICAHTIAIPFFSGGNHPLATLGWPSTRDDANRMPVHPQDFVQCPACSHVWNRSFRYDAIPYEKNPNRMFNSGAIWGEHLVKTRDLITARLPETPVVVEIGCGEGHFLRGIAKYFEHQGSFAGFDPNSSDETGRGLSFHARLFDPLIDMLELKPDAVIIRHVIEHLTEPTVLLDQIAWGASQLEKPCMLFVEVPCIDRVFSTHRLADFFYEHCAHFTTTSFERLLSRTGDLLTIDQGYDGEVVYGLVNLGISSAWRERAAKAREFAAVADQSRADIHTQLIDLHKQGLTIAIWGGTGKAAAFMHQFGVDAKRFPLVVDSDQDKCGYFVPGTGQEIQYRDVLKDKPVDIVIIPTQWRAKDIVAEMRSEGIQATTILIEHDGKLVNFLSEPHPYH